MKKPIFHRAAGLSVVVAVCLLSSHPTEAAEKAAARTVEPAPKRPSSIISSEIPVITLPDSEFVANYSDVSARDPFFPQANYVKQGRKRTEPAPALKAEPSDSVLKPFKVNGVGVLQGKRWAMLNGVTVFAGESATFQVNNTPVDVECIDVTEKQVTIGIKGTSTRREIKLD
jgi:hypothetical protein